MKLGKRVHVCTNASFHWSPQRAKIRAYVGFRCWSYAAHGWSTSI